MPPILTIDVALLALVDGQLSVALIKRDKAPSEGLYALPGGYVHEDEDEDVKGAAERVLKEKLAVKPPYLEEFGTFSGKLRDPRGWSLTVVHYALTADPVDSPLVKVFPVGKLPGLPFDHNEIIARVVERVRSKTTYSSLPVHLMPKKFTIPELHAAYEAILGERMNLASFRRKVDGMGALEEVPGEMRVSGRSRPAQVYRVALRYRSKLSLRGRGL
jgi:8-oxo-dGTP diphosphatase